MASQEHITAVMAYGTRLEWTTLRRRKGRYEVAEQKAVELDIPEKSEDRDAAQWAAQIKQALGGVKGHLTVVLRTERALVRAVDLPSADRDELAGMVELQVDKFSPFPIEHMAVSHESLGASGAHSRVLIAACKRDVVDNVGERFAAAGRRPDRIDVAAAGWWYLLRAHDAAPSEGRHGILLVNETGTDLIVAQNGWPVVVRSMSANHDMSDEEFVVEIAEETGYALTSLESEWGASNMTDLTVWHRGSSPDVLIERLTTECATTVRDRSLDELPPLTEGVARRDVEKGGAALDLSPPEWKIEAADRSAQRRLLTVVGSLVLGWLAVLAVFWGIMHVDHARMVQLREEIVALEAPAEEARLLRRRVESLEQYADRTYSALECLREISERLPRGVELTAFTYRKGSTVNLRGQSPSVQPIYDFFDELEASDLFVEVRPEGVTQAPGGRRNPEFRVTAHLPGEAQ